MTFSVLNIFLIVLVLTIKIVYDTLHNRKKITIMVGMMISMVLGMIVGFTIGIIIGITLSNNFFYATVISASVGIFTGLLAGLPIGWLAILDGILAGLMGGTMGAMIGTMMQTEYHDPLIKLSFLLYIATMMLLFKMIQRDITKKQSLFGNPIFLLVLFVLTILTYNLQAPFVQNNYPTQLDMPVKEIVVNADDHLFKPNKIKVRAGERVKITLDNIGQVEHDFEIIGMKTELIDSQTSHNHNSSNLIHIHSLPGEKETISFIPITPGEYRFICTMPGHAKSGMTGIIEITS